MEAMNLKDIFAHFTQIFIKIAASVKGKKHGKGHLRGTPDDRDFPYVPVTPIEKLPPSVDLRPWCPPVMDQEDIGSCTAHGTTGALRYLLIKNRA